MSNARFSHFYGRKILISRYQFLLILAMGHIEQFIIYLKGLSEWVSWITEDSRRGASCGQMRVRILEVCEDSMKERGDDE